VQASIESSSKGTQSAISSLNSGISKVLLPICGHLIVLRCVDVHEILVSSCELNC
jgi:hypothetical protein